MNHILETIKKRRSVRTFQKKEIDPAILKVLEDFGRTIENPFGIPVEFVFMNAAEKDLSSPVLSGEPEYVASLVKKVPYGEEAVGYSFEALMLKAVEMGLGTVWIGGTMDRDKFELACGKKDDERMPCITPLGWPAGKSLRETMMRKGVGADKRKNAAQLFFENDFDTPLNTEDKVILDALEAVRWAPSAVNKQPWRIVKVNDTYYFFEKHDKNYISEAVGDMQKIDIGIAMYHFDAVLEENGYDTELVTEDPAIAMPEGMEYICGLRIAKR